MKLPTIRNYFLAGLLVLVPVFITLSVLNAGVGFFSNTLIGQKFDLWANEVLFKRDQDHLIPGFGLAATLVVILLTGMIASTVGGHRIFEAIEAILTRAPLIKTIYPPAKQIIDFLLAPKGKGFRDVVLVEFPRAGIYSLGFVTGEAPPQLSPPSPDGKTLRHLSVFVPFAPAPMSGALLVLPEESVIPIAMSVEEAFKYIISAGVLAPETTGLVP